MPALSYNEEQHEQVALRHLFIPGTYGLLSETIIAVVTLLLFNLSTLSNQLLSHDAGVNVSPLSLWRQAFDQISASVQRHAAVQTALLFILWAVAGALLYVLAFRLVQLLIRTRSSVRQGALLVQAQHKEGVMRYFASLHDFFIRLIIAAAGIAALVFGAFFCFAIASQELDNGLHDTLPGSLLDFLLAFIGAFLAVRVIVIGISLLSQRFRTWYNS